jgi:hypothetical protein
VDIQSVPRNEPAHKAPPPSSPALGHYAKGPPAALFLSGATGLTGRFNEGFLLRRLHAPASPVIRSNLSFRFGNSSPYSSRGFSRRASMMYGRKGLEPLAMPMAA